MRTLEFSMRIANAATDRVILFVSLGLVSVFAPAAHAIPYLFTNPGAGNFALVTGANVTGLTANNDSVTAPSSTDPAFGFSSGITFTSTGPATFTGVADFSDPITKSTGGTCNGGTCFVNSTSSISNTNITGGTFYAPGAVATAVQQWLDLTSTATGWGSVAGTAANVGSGGTLCAGSGFTGCSYTATTTHTITVGGQSQTAYVFDITSSGDHINNPLTIKGDGSALIILNYGGTQKLQSNKAITLSGGVGDDQVLLNVTSSGGMQTSGGFTFSGALAVTGAAASLDNAGFQGRIFLNGTGTSSIQSGFNLTAPPDIPGSSTAAPEPGTALLLGGSLAFWYVFKRRCLV
jgi:hypothetical protein